VYDAYRGPEVDLWSLGIVLYSMLMGDFPFKSIANILNGKFKEPENISMECLDLLKGMLTVKKENRETVEGAINHPWIKMSQEEVIEAALCVTELKSRSR